MRYPVIGALAVLVSLAALPSAAAPDDDAREVVTPETQALLRKMTAIRDTLSPRHGSIPLPQAHARLNLGPDFYFLGPADARKVLVDGWLNPPDHADDVLGMVFPVGSDLTNADWGAVITYEPTGYISDREARTADYEQVLATIRSGEDEDNAQRKKRGYSQAHLVGWAQSPTYDGRHNDLIWGTELQFTDGSGTWRGMNYDVRHLGRSGVLMFEMVGDMSELPAVRAAAPALAMTAEFDPGSRYADHSPGDRTARYGLAGLIVAGAGVAVVKKAGLLAGLVFFAKKAITLIIASMAAVVAGIRRLFRRKKPVAAPLDLEPETHAAEPDAPA